ncbi:hypothetical protein [Demequina aurantiaca]|uniref:hypothetical protein n=1 Tax=Demequina aurantiaca TaxID=676200 RepID=UPI003D34C947
MDSNQVLILIGLAVVVVLLIVLVVAIRRRKARAFAALSAEERELKYAKDAYTARVGELKGELKATEKESRNRSQRADDQLKEATSIGSDTVQSLKGNEGTVSLTGLSLTTPTGERALTTQTTAVAELTGTAASAEDPDETRLTTLTLGGDGLSEVITFGYDKETEVRSLAAKITSVATQVDTLRKQRDDAVAAAEQEVADATSNATIEATNAQARYDAAEKESMAKVRAAEDAVRLRGINPS